MHEYIALLQTGTEESSIELKRTKYIIGRSKINEVLILDSNKNWQITIPDRYRFVSRNHAAFVLMPPDREHEYPYYIIQDTSQNGTMINGILINKYYTLRDRDVITFAGSVYPRISFLIDPNNENSDIDKDATINAERT